MQTTGDEITRRQRAVLAVTAVIAALSRFAALSKSPWDWDEVLFCLALNDYDVASHQPHPPGFPLYVALAKLARIFADTDFHALQTINVLAGMLALPVMFWAARAFRMDFHGALAAGILFTVLPNVWFYGGTAFSDLPAAVLFLAAVAAYIGRGTTARRYYAGAVLLAAGVLVRPQNALVAVFPWTVATVRLAQAKRWRTVVAASLLLIALVAIGYGAAIYATGADAYIHSFRHHSAYVKSADSHGAPGRPPLWDVFRVQLDPYEAGKAAIAMNVLALVAIIGGKRRTVTEILLTFLPSFLFALLTVNPLGASRFSLNYIAGIVLLAVEGAAVIGRLAGRLHPRAHHPVRAAVIAVVAGRIVTWVLPAFEVPRTTAAPPVLAAMWLQKNVPPDRTIFVDESARPWAKYYLARYKTVRAFADMNVVTNPEAAHGWFLANGATSARNAIHFVRPRTRTWNIVTKRVFEAYVQPAASVVLFADGWHAAEGDVSNSWRWAQRRSLLLLGPAAGKSELRMRFHVPLHALEEPVTVTFRLNGARIATLAATDAENEVRYVVSPREDGPNRLEIEVSDSFVPADQGGGDPRELALMMRSVEWTAR